MELLAILTKCSLAKDFGLVFAMAMSHSGGDPYTVRSAGEVDVAYDGASDDDGEAPRTREKALADIRSLEQPLIGLLPVPPAWAAVFLHRPEDLLDPCINVSVATAQLALYERRCAKSRDVRSCALHAYAQEADALLFEFEVIDRIEAENPPRSAPAIAETSEILDASPFVSLTPKRNEPGSLFVFLEPESNAEAQAAPNAQTKQSAVNKQPADNLPAGNNEVRP